MSGGANNYAFETKNGISKAIVEGFSLNHVAIQTINNESIQKIVTEDQRETLSVDKLIFKRDKKNWKNSTEIIKKKYRYYFHKRNVINDHQTLPWGF